MELCFDLSFAGTMGVGTLTFANGALCAVFDGKPVFSRPLAGAKALVQRMGVGCAWLELCLTDRPEDALPVCRFSLLHLEAAGRFLHVVNHWLATGETLAFPTAPPNQCPKCGHRFLPAQSVCLRCGNQKQAFWAQMFRWFAPWQHWLWLSLVCLLGTSGLTYLGPVLQRWLVDHILRPAPGRSLLPLALPWATTPLRALLVVGAVLLLCRLLAALLQHCGNLLLSNRANLPFQHFLRCHSYNAMQRLSLASVQTRTTGSIISRLTSDTNTISQFVANSGRQLLSSLLNFVAAAVFLFATNWWMALLALLPFPLLLVIFRLFHLQMRTLFHKSWRASSAERSVLNDILRGIRVVKTYGSEARETAKFAKRSQRVATLSTRAEHLWAIWNPLTALTRIAVELLILYFGGLAVLHGTLSVGDLMLFTLVLPMLMESIQSIVGFPRQWSEMNTSLLRLFDLLSEVPAMQKTADSIAPPLDGSIAFEQVRFGYKSYEPVLQALDLQIRPGEMLGLVGSSGAGKSTLINLAMRFYDADAGTVRMAGHNIADLDPGYLRQHIGAVFQETFLFVGTIYDNICYSKPQAAPQEVLRAARVANAHEFILRLPDGYNTVIGENGYTLSGGERQRLAIARVVLKDPKILILDEATSALDPETEHLIQEALARLVQGRTTIAIAHRLTTLRHADRLAVLDNGRIAELGTHKELLLQKGIYYKLVLAQKLMSET